MIGRRPPRKKAGVMDLVRSISDPDLIETIEYIKANKNEIKLALDQLKEAAGQRSLKDVLDDLATHATMIEKTLKHVQVHLTLMRKLHPAEYEEAVREVNEAWKKTGRDGSL